MCTILALCLICARKFGTLPNLCAQIRQIAKFVQCLNFAENRIWSLLKFVNVPNLRTQIKQGAKFVRKNLARCQNCAHNLGKVPNLYSLQIFQSVKFDHGSNLANCQICAHKLGKVPKLCWKIRQGAKIARTYQAKYQICIMFKFSREWYLNTT